MKTAQYKVTAPGSDKYITVTYQDGQLCAIENIHLMTELWDEFNTHSPIPTQEWDIDLCREWYKEKVSIEPVEPSATGSKIALFCAIYQQELGVKYQVRKGDAMAIGLIEVNEDLLHLYFRNTEWWGKQPKGIANLSRNYNALLQLRDAPKKEAGKSKFPDDWSAEYERKLSPKDLSAYWAHLRSKGWKAKKNGSITTWTKAAFISILIVLMASGCMTPQRIGRYMDRNPELFTERVDTFYKPILFNIHDTIRMPADTGAWEWLVDDSVQDTILIGRTDSARAETKVQVTKQPEGVRVRASTQVRPDTVYLEKQIEVPCPEITRKTTIILKRNGWMKWALIGMGILLILALWRRKK